MLVEVDEKVTEYYTATVDRNQYEWTLHSAHTGPQYAIWFEIDAWCTKTFGEQGMWGSTISAWKRMGPSYYFQHERDREIFVLRWS